MTAKVSRPPRRAYPWRRRLLKTVSALLLAALAVVVVLAYFQHGRHQRIDAELDRIRAQGMPASTEEHERVVPGTTPRGESRRTLSASIRSTYA